MDIKRSINTRMWSDCWFEDLTATNKLLWIYLLTNQNTNMAGIYEISLKRISNETSIPHETLSKALEDFERVRKAYFIDGFVFIPNWIKNQSMNPNMIKSAESIYNGLHNWLKDKLKEIGVESFESLSKGSVTLPNRAIPKIEIEIEREIEKEKEREIGDSFNLFWELYQKKTGREKSLARWSKLTTEERKKILDYVPVYVKSTPDPKYRKNPETFLNNKSWNDEIIFHQSQPKIDQSKPRPTPTPR